MENFALNVIVIIKSTYDYKRIIKASDRATLLNLMVGLNAFTLCTGIICEELNGDGYKAINYMLCGSSVKYFKGDE